MFCSDCGLKNEECQCWRSRSRDKDKGASNDNDKKSLSEEAQSIIAAISGNTNAKI